MNLTAFPFFDSLPAMREATRHGERLYATVSRFLPFQIRKRRDNQPIDCINVYRENGTLLRRYMGDTISYTYHQTLTHDFVTYYGATLPEPLPCGTYYLEIGGRYSALFTALNSVEELLRVEWINNANLADNAGNPLVLYQTGFLQRVFLKAEVKEPTYPYAETGNENEYKEFLPDFKRVVKQSQFTTLPLPVYLADALGALPLHATVHVGSYSEVKEIEVSPEWYDYGTSASVTVKFSESTPVIAMGCAKDLELEEIDTASYSPRGFLCGVTDNNPAWVNTGVTSCEKANGVNTGYLLVEQRDTNPNSPSYNETRTVRGAMDTVACAVTTTYYSREVSEYVKKNDCGSGFEGTTVLVKVAARAYTSTISQLDADNKALAHLNSIKQQEANSRGTCEPVATYKFIGNVSQRYSTSSQACTALDLMVPVYSEDGTYNSLSGLYTGPQANATRLPTGFYKRASDSKVMDIWDGIVNGVFSCGSGEEEEF